MLNNVRLSCFGMVAAALFLCGAAGVKAEKVAVELTQQTFNYEGERYQVKVPYGYTLELVAAGMERPRMMSFTQTHELLIGSVSGNVYRLQAPYHKVQLLADLGGYPHSAVVRDGQLYVSMTDGVYQAAYRPNSGPVEKDQFEKLIALPGGRGHSSRTIQIGPDQRIYLSLGISGNCSNQYIAEDYQEEQRRGGVMVLSESAEMPHWKPYVTGLRNPVGFAWQPRTNMMYVSNNGPDHWGYDLPPEYFSRAPAASFHGMPWFQFDGSTIKRDSCIKIKPPRKDVTRPEVVFPARSAPMGVTFITSGEFENDAIVALHGSWATLPSGGYGGDQATRRPPKLLRVRFNNEQAEHVEDFVTGFQLKNGKRWLRPVDVAYGPDNAIYFTSDAGINGLFRLQKVNQEAKL